MDSKLECWQLAIIWWKLHSLELGFPPSNGVENKESKRKSKQMAAAKEAKAS